MTVSELAMEKSRQIGRDVAFDLLLDRASRGFSDTLLLVAPVFIFLFIMEFQFDQLNGLLPVLLPVAAIPATKMAALLGILAWLGYGVFGLRRRNRIERGLIQAQINALRLQQLAEQS